MLIDETHAGLKAAYEEWKDLLVNVNFVRSGLRLTWSSDRRPWIDDPMRARDMNLILEERAFSFQVLRDAAAVQLFYEFRDRGRRLTRASLAYYRLDAVDSEFGSISAEETEDVERSTDGGCESGNDPLFDDTDRMALAEGMSDHCSWLRIDYEPEAASGALHHSCHLHISGLREARLSLNAVPSPQQFMEWLVALCYPSDYAKHRMDEAFRYRFGGESRYPSVEDLIRYYGTPLVVPIEAGAMLPFVAFPRGWFP